MNLLTPKEVVEKIVLFEQQKEKEIKKLQQQYEEEL